MALIAAPMDTAAQTLEKIRSRMKMLGDLPIFSASINRIRRMSAAPDSDAMKLAKEIMKDANLATKVLRLANSPYYNRSRTRIGVISRAVVVLGFHTLKNISLTVKLIESFQHEHPSINMGAMLVRSYLSAGFVQELALRSGVKDVEESYTCALLHTLGEVAVAYFMPDDYAEILQRQKDTGASWTELQHAVLGLNFSAIGQALAGDWQFPSSVVQSMGQYDPERDSAAHDKVQLNRAMASLANKVVGSVYAIDQGGEDVPLTELFQAMSKLTGVGMERIENCLTDSFQQSCALADEFGLNKAKLMPVLKESGDAKCDGLARQFAYLASAGSGARIAEAAAVSPPSPSPARSPAPLPAPTAIAPTEAAPAAADPHWDRQLALLQEITSLISEAASLNIVFGKVAQGLVEGVGFDHAALCLLNRDRSAYGARIALGPGAAALKDYFQKPVNVEGDLFSRVLMEGGDLLVEDAADKAWAGALPPHFADVVAASSFAVAPLRIDGRPIGLFYADKTGGPLSISQEEYRGFIQFVSQAKLALQLAGRARLA